METERNVTVDIIPQNGDDIHLQATPAEAVLLRGLRTFELPTGRMNENHTFVVHSFELTLLEGVPHPTFGVVIRGRYNE